MAAKRDGLGRRGGKQNRKAGAKPTKSASPRLGLESLETRALLAVTSSLNNGVLDIALGAANDSAAVSVLKPNNTTVVDVFDGTVHQQYPISTVNSINAHGTGAAGQSLQLHSALALGQALTVSQLASTTVDGTYQASAINVQSSQVHLNGGVLSSRKIAPGGDPASALSIGNSGDILISTTQIDSTAAAKILANATAGFLPGNIKINASDNQNGSSASAAASINFTSATISGGDVSLTANSAASATVNNPALNVANLSVSSSATITLGGATSVIGSGNVLISANSIANTNASVQAQSSSTDTTADAAVAKTSLTSNAITHIGGTSSVSAGGVLTINASNNTTANSLADGSAGGPNAGGASVAYANLAVDTEAYADSQATLAANQLRVTASSQTTGATSAKATAKAVTANTQATQTLLNQQNAKSSGGAIALAAAVGVTNVTDKTLAYVASSAPINATQDLQISSTSGANVSNTADAGAAGNGGKTTGEGVSVAVGHSSESNKAYVGGTGLVTAKGISVNAANPAGSPNSFASQATSGVSKKDSTVEGAAAFEIATVGNEAFLAAGSNVNPSGGDLTIKASGDTSSTASAQPAPGANPGSPSKGMGASLAVNILTDLTRAEIEDNAKVTQTSSTPAINNLTVSSTAHESMNTNAQAGADPTVAGTSFSGYSSAVGISLLNTTTSSRIGAGTATAASGKLSVDATHKAEVANTTGGNSAGQGVLGAATAVSVTSSQTTATTVRELTIGGDASISTHADLSAGADATASARGGRTSGNGTADSEAASQLAFANSQATAAGAQGTNGASAPSAKTNNGNVAGAGAVALDLVTASKSEATVAANEKLTVGGALTVTSTNDTDAHAKADGSATANAATGIGVAVAINAVSNESNKADILGGAIVKAKGVTIQAVMDPSGDATNTLAATATSGISAVQTGIAGSVAINAAKLVTESVIAPSAQVDSTGSDLSLNAQDNTKAIVSATPGLDQNNAAKGVGISFGLNVVEDDTTAAIQDGSIVTGAKNISLNAGSSDTLQTTVQTGIQATNNAFGAAVGISTLTAPTSATIGTNAANPITNSGNVALSASHTGGVTTTTGGELAAASGTALGASVSLSVEKVDTTATINRGVTAGGGVSVNTQNASAGNAQAKATSKGGKADDNSTPQTAVDSEASNDLAQADAAGASVGAAGSNGAKAPKAQTDSGGMSVAGAVAINIDQSSTSVASIAPGQKVTANGAVSVVALNDSDSSAQADGSATTTGSTGVGVAVAIDAATGIATRAFIGNGAQITATGLTVQTGMSASGDGVNTLSADAKSGAGASQTGVAGALAIEIGKVVTESFIDTGAKVTLTGGDLNIITNEKTSSEASAVPTKDLVLGTDKGIGVSAAFNILEDDARAEIIDTATVTGAKGVTLAAGTNDTLSTTAETGVQSSNGLALSASLAASILNANTKARIGSDAVGGTGLTASGDVNVSAAHVDSVTTSAGGDGKGATKAIGIALGLGYEGVSTTATTDRDITAGAVTFSARSASATSTTATASATGAADVSGQNKSTNQQANATKNGLDAKASAAGVQGTDAGSTVPDAKTSNGDSVAVAGALAVDIVGHSTTSATIPDGRKINATGALTLSALSDLDAASKADGSAKGTAATGVGVAVAITVVPNESTLATIGKNDHISAHGVNLTAGMSSYNDQTNDVSSSAISGASATEKAGAGALGLTVFMPKTEALIQNDPANPGSTTVNLNGGPLNISAQESTNSIASAVPSKDMSTGKSLGVGLSFGFNIIEADTRAEVQNGAAVSGGSDVSLNATSNEVLTTNASAGATATGGTGVAASAAASALTSATTARWGSNSNLSATGGITIAATHQDNLRTDVGSQAKGSETTVGAAIALNYEKINTVATTDSDLMAGGAIHFSAHNASSTEATAIASATGAKDKQGGGSKTGAKDAADATKSSLNANAMAASPNAQGVDPNATVPDAKTSNGDSISVAGAIAVDLPIQVHAIASIPDGRHITAGGALQLDSKNDIDAISTADGTAKGDASTGVGVALAITVVPDAVNSATIGKNDVISAHGVTLAATMSNANDQTNDVGATAISGASASEKAGAGALALTVFTPQTLATIDQSNVNANGGPVNLTAVEATRSTVSATPAKDQITAKSLGVGVSFGFNIIEPTTTAEIKDNAVVINAGNVALNASSTDTLTTEASAGAAASGGTAVAASGAASALTSATTARIGALPNATMQAGNVTVAAQHVDIVNTTAGDDAKGTETTVGAAIAVTYEKVNTLAVTDRDLNATGAVTFSSHNASATSANANASATGAKDAQNGGSQTGATDEANSTKDSLNTNAKSADPNAAGVDPSASVPDTKTSNGDSVAVAGAIAVDLPLQVHSTASIPNGRHVTSGGLLRLDATNDTDATSAADGTAKGDATTGVGVAVAVTVAPDVTTEANIGVGAVIDAHGVTMSAGMSNANDGINTVGASAMSGASASDKAGAGALAFSLFLPKTQALIEDNAQANAELGDISASATEATTSTVSAAPSVDKLMGKSIGVGLSFGINIVETDTRAEIDNNVTLNGPGNYKPHNVQLSATSTDTLNTSASSGAAAKGDSGAKAVSASVGVGVLNANTDATIGNGTTLTATGAINLAATHTDNVTTTVGSDASADNTAVGISIGFTYEDVTTKTTTNRDLSAGGAIGFASHNDSNSQTITKASGTGGQDVGGANSQTEANDEAENVKSTTNQNAAAASNNSAQGIDPSTDIPEAKNGDGKGVAVAGAFSLDLPVKIDVEATIPSHHVVSAGGDLSLEALNHVNASSLADGTAVSQGSTGVGVAIAMTLLPSDQTIATIGDHSTIAAKGVSLKAGMLNNQTNEIASTAISGASASEKAGSGAFAFDLFLAGTHAEIGNNSIVTGNGDDLALSADELTVSVVNAKPSVSNGNNQGGGGSTHDGGQITGVGVAVALNIVQIDTHAEIDPSITASGFHDTTLNATSHDSLLTKAQAGITLGNAANSDAYGAEFAVTFLKTQTYARVDGGGSLGTGHDIVINAQHSDNVSTIADGLGNGTGDAVGIAIGFTYDDSQTTANTLESLTAGNAVTISADNATSANTNSISSQTGGPDATNSTPQDGVDQEGQKSRGLADSYSSEFGASQTGSTQNPSAQTSNSKISVAGALSINIIGESNSLASTTPNTFIHAGGPLTVSAHNDTDAHANATGAATTTGTTGVGVAIALNIAPNVTTSATIGASSDIQAHGVTVSAGMSNQNDAMNVVGADAKSGGAASDKAGAGGLGLSLFFPTTLAEIGKHTTVNAKQGDVAITAQSNTFAEAKAIPGLLGGQTTGVGISIAVDGVEDHTTADIPDTVTLTNVGALTVTADSTDAASSLAQAGTTPTLGGNNNNSSGGAGAAAVTVVTADTHASVGTGTDINAAGAVNIAASHQGDTSATVTANAQAAKTEVGIGIGVNVELINTTADIHRNMSSVGPFTVAAHTHSNASASAAASASGADGTNAPANGVDQQTTNQRSYANTQITNNGGQAANSSENTSAQTAQGNVSVAGAAAINIVHAHSDATIPDGLTIHANNGQLTVSAWNAGDGTASADGSAAGNAKTGVGIAVAVNSIDAEAIASIGDDTITSNGLVVEAILGNVVTDQNYSATAVSGAGAKTTGVAGSVALNFVLHSKHDATIASGADINANGGDVTVQAASSSTDTATATPHDGGGSASDTGVGASVALNLMVQESHATIANGATITNAGNFAVTADSTNTITTEAKNGAQGKTAVGVSVALTYDNNDVKAYVGSSNTGINATGNAKIQANAKDVATTTTDSVDVGKDTAVGVSIAVGILNTSEAASLNRNLIAGGSVSVTTTDTAKSTTKSTAAVVGTPFLPNAANSDSATTNQTSFADGLTGGNSSGSVPSLGSSESTANTSAGSNGNSQSSTSVGVAAVIAVDVELVNMTAEIAPNLTVHGGGAVRVGTTSETDGSAEADGAALALGSDTTAATASVAVNAAIVHNNVTIGTGDDIAGNGIAVYAIENLGQTNDFGAQALAGSGSTGGGAGAGSAAVNVLTVETLTTVGQAKLNSTGVLDVVAQNPMTLKNFTGGLALSKDSGAGIAIGINLVLEHYTEATIADGSTLDAVKATHVTSTAGITPSGDLPETLMSLAIGIAGSTDNAVGGSTIVDFFDEKTFAQIGNNTTVNKTAVGGLDQSVIVSAKDTMTVRNAAGGLAGAGGSGVGVGVIVDVLNVDSHATIGDTTTINAGGDVRATAESDDQFFGLCLVAGLASDNAVSVSVTVFVPDYETHASIGANDQIIAGGNVIVAANHDLKVELYGGSLAIGGSNGFGAQVVTMPLHETTEAFIAHNAHVLAKGQTPAVNVSTGVKNNGQVVTQPVSGVSVTAVAFNDFTTVAVGGAVSGGVSLSGSAVVDDQHVNTLAHIDQGAIVYATNGQPAVGPSINLLAANPTTMTSLAGALAGGSSAGIGLGVDVAIVSKNTQAYSDAAVMAADTDVIIKALSSEDVTSITGSITVGGSAAIGGSASVYVFDVTTRAYFGYDASDPTAVKTSNIGIAFGNFQVGARESSSFLQIAGNVAVGGTASVGAGAVVPVVTKHTESFIGQGAQVAALGMGNAVDADTGRYTVTYGVATYPSTMASAAPSNQHRNDIDGNNGTTPNNRLDGRRAADFETSPVHGVVVTAVNRDDLILVGANAGIAGTAAVNATGAINVVSNTTSAHIDTGAQINNVAGVTPSPDQSVVVAAGNDFSVVAIAAGLSVSGTASIALSGTVLVATETTIADVDDGAVVQAKRDIVVQAHTSDDILTVAASVAGAGGVSGSVAASVVVLNDTTHAFIGNLATTDAAGAQASAGGNIVIAASDDTSTLSIAGGLAVGGLGGMSASVGVTVMNKDTEAFAGDHSTINAAGNSSALTVSDGTNNKGAFGTDNTFHGLDIAATSSENIFQLGASGAGGVYVGIAGGVAVELITANTNAFIGKNAHINNNVQGTDRHTPYSVEVSAEDSAKDFSLGGGVGIGVVGIAGGIDVGILRNNTSAFIDDNANVRATGDINVYGLSSEDIQSYGISGAGGLGAVAGSVSVWSIGTDYGTSYTNDGKSGDALHSSDSNGPDEVTGATNSSDDAGSKFQSVADTYLDPSMNPGLSHTKNYGDAHTMSHSSIDQNAQGGQVKSAIASHQFDSGTSARIRDGVTLNAVQDINIKAHDHLAFSVADGTVAVGFVGLGGAVAVVNLDSQVYATMGANDTVNAGGDVNLQGVFDDQVKVFVLAGSGGIVAGGANVAVIHDDSTQEATIGTNTAIERAHDITVESLALRTMHADTAAVQGGGLAVGVTYVELTQDGHTTANIADGVQIGAAFGKQVTGSVLVIAGANNALDDQAFGFAVGLAAGSLDHSKLSITPTVSATVGKNVTILVNGGITVDSFSFADANSEMLNVTGGGISLSVMIADAIVTPFISATVGGGSNLQAGGAIAIEASHNYDANGKPTTMGAHTKATAPGGGVATGTGVSTTSTANAITSVNVATGASLSAGTSVTLSTKLANNADATSLSASASALGVGVSLANATANGAAVTALNGDIVGASTIQITSDTTNNATADSTAIGFGGATVEGGKAVAIASPVNGSVVGGLTNTSFVSANSGITIAATDLSSAKADGLTVSIGGLFSAGLVHAEAQNKPTVGALVSPGSTVSSSFGDINISASHNSRSTGGAIANSFAPGGGLLSGNGSESITDASAQVQANVGRTAVLDAGGDIIIAANSFDRSNSTAKAATFGVVGGVGTVDAESTSSGKTFAYLDGYVVRGDNLKVQAVSSDKATSTAEATGGGLLFGGNGAKANATVSPTITSRIGDGTLNPANYAKVDGDITINSNSITAAEAHANTTTGSGFVGIGISSATATSTPTITSTVGNFTKLTSNNGSVTVAAVHNAANQMDALATTQAPATFGGFVAGTGMAPTAISTPVTSATVGDRVIILALQDVDVNATSTMNAKADCDSTSISGGVSIGAGDAKATANGTTTALVRGIIGNANDVTIEAHGGATADAHGNATALGILAGAAGVTATSLVQPTTLALIGDKTASGSITARGDVSVLADDHVLSTAYSQTTAGGVVGIGISKATATATPTVGAVLTSGSINTKGDVTIHAELKLNDGEETASSTAQSPGGGLISGNGAVTHATASPNVYAGSDVNTVINTSAQGNIDVLAKSHTIADSSSKAETVSLILGIGASDVQADVETQTNALVWGKTTTGGSLAINADSTDRAFTDGQAAGGSTISLMGVSAKSTVNPTTNATLGASDGSSEALFGGNVIVNADENAYGTSTGGEFSISLAGVGVVNTETDVTPKVTAKVGQGTVVNGNGLSVGATFESSKQQSTATANATSGAFFVAITSTSATVNLTPVVLATVEPNAIIGVNGDFNLTTSSTNLAKSEAGSQTFSGVGGGGGVNATTNLGGSSKALAQGVKTLLVGGNLNIDAEDSSMLSADTNALAGGILGAFSASDSEVNSTRDVQAHLGAGVGTVVANTSATIKANATELAKTEADGEDVSGGVGAGTSVAKTSQTTTVTAKVDDNTALTSRGAFIVSATGANTTNGYASASGGGGLAGGDGSDATMYGNIDVQALLGKGVVIHAASIDVGADSKNDANGDADGSAGGLFAGVGSQVAQTDLYSNTIAKSDDSSAAHKGSLNASGDISFHAHGEDGGLSITTGGSGGFVGAGGASNSFYVHAPYVLAAVGDNTTINAGGTLSVLASDSLTPISVASAGSLAVGGVASQGASSETIVSNEELDANLGHNVTGSALGLTIHAWQANVQSFSEADANATAPVGLTAEAHASSEADAKTFSHIHVMSGTNLTLTNGIDINAFGPNNVYTNSAATASTSGLAVLISKANAGSVRDTDCCVTIDAGVTMSAVTVSIHSGANPPLSLTDNYLVDGSEKYEGIDLGGSTSGSNTNEPPCIENDGTFKLTGKGKKKAKIGNGGSVDDLADVLLVDQNGNAFNGAVNGPFTVDSLRTDTNPSSFIMQATDGTTEGHSTIEYDPYSDVQIINDSPFAMTLGSINTFDNVGPKITHEGMDGGALWTYDLVADNGAANVDIENTNSHPTDLIVQGPLFAPGSDVKLVSAAGNILGGGASTNLGAPPATFLVRSLTAEAPRGMVGSPAAPIAPQFAVDPNAFSGFGDVTGLTGVYLNPTFAALGGTPDFFLGNIHALSGPAIVRVNDGQMLSFVNRDGLRALFTPTSSTFHVGDIDSGGIGVSIVVGVNETLMQDVSLEGVVSAPKGQVVISALHGDLTSGGDTQLVEGQRVTLNAMSVGTSDLPILVAIAPVTSTAITGGDTDLRNGLNGVATTGDFYARSVRGSLLIGRVASEDGDVGLSMVDNGAPGENFIMPNGSSIDAELGAVVITSADDVMIAPGATITGGRSITTTGGAHGSVMELDGALNAPLVNIEAGGGDTSVALRQVLLGTTVTLNTNDANATFYVGSAAIAGLDVTGRPAPVKNGGNLSTIQGRLVVQGSTDGVGHTHLVIEDDGDTVSRTVTIDANALIGLLDQAASTDGSTLPIYYANVDALDVLLGRGNDLINMKSLDPATATTVDAGDGDDTFIIGQIGKMNDGVDLPLILGGLGNDTVQAADSINYWDLTGQNQGTVTGDNAFRFASIENLLGGALDDLFHFEDGAKVDGSITGGRGQNVLDYSAYLAPVTVNLLDGTATGVGRKISNITKVIYPRS